MRALLLTLALLAVSASARKQSISNNEIKRISSELFNSDANNVFSHLSINPQGKVPYSDGSGTDYARFDLIDPFNATRYLGADTYKALVNFYDNFERDSDREEVTTRHEHDEEVHFINKISETQPIRKMRDFLVAKGYLPRSINQFKRTMKALWFDFYSRNRRRKQTSSGFEHVLMGEIKRGQVSGFHNWVYFYTSERKNQVNYLGYKKYKLLGRGGSVKAAVIKFTFKWHNKMKPVTSMLVGTSPEMELALFTLCFYARPNQDCRVTLGGENLVVKTHTYRSSGKIMPGSAYVDL